MKKLSKPMVLTMSLLLVVISCLVLFFIHQKSVNSVKALDFQAYSPTHLPAGTHVTGHETGVIKSPGNDHKEVDIVTSLFKITEEKNSVEQNKALLDTCDVHVLHIICSANRSPHGQEYVSKTYLVPSGSVFEQVISWHKNATWISIIMVQPHIHQLSTQEWESFIDSFVPVNYGSEPGTVVVHLSFG